MSAASRRADRTRRVEAAAVQWETAAAFPVPALTADQALSEPWDEFQIAFAEASVRGEERARSLLHEMLARDTDARQPAYNAACFEALAGSIDAALDHLRHALALGPPRVRQLVADGEDLAALRRGPAMAAADRLTTPRAVVACEDNLRFWSVHGAGGCNRSQPAATGCRDAPC